QVHQDPDPAKPDEKGVFIEGDTLQLDGQLRADGSSDGNFLIVRGDLAKLLMDKLLVTGPEVNINQAENKAWVTGAGAMQMESSTAFGGQKTDKPVPLTVYWNESMYFEGSYAEFQGAIQAEQLTSHVSGQSMQVYFDRPISLKEGNKSDEPARVKDVVIDKKVDI